MDTTSSVEVAASVPEHARKLIWEVFFASRDRGISLSVHFPWIDAKENVFCLTIGDPDSKETRQTIATMVIKCSQSLSGERFGLVGLVCVAEEWRGKGLSSRLMSEAIDFSKKINLDALVLWTQKPEVYTKHGFIVDSQDQYGLIEKASLSKVLVEFKTDRWPGFKDMQDRRGLPPFAVDGKSISSGLATLIVAESKSGVTLAEWHGPDFAVVDLLECALPMRFGINAREENSLFSELLKRKFKVDLKPGSLRLVKYLKTSSVFLIPEIQFLDRI